MKRVDNSDVNIKLDSRIVYLSNFTAKFYTVNAENFFISKTQDNVISAETEDNDTEYYIKLDWNELVTLGEGVLQYKIVNNIPDSDRADLYFNKNLERTTEYYINSNVIVDPESEQSYADIIAELGVKIDSEIARSTSADTELNLAIQNEVITRQQNVSDITDLISANTSAIVNEITNRQNADDSIISAVTELDVRKLDASAYTPTDLSNYYTKIEVDNAIAAIDVSGQLSGYVQSSVFSAYSASVATEIEDNELATSEAINDINSRLINIVDEIDDNELATSEAINDLNSRVINIVDNTYTKTEVDTIVESIDVSDQLSDYLTISAFTQANQLISTSLNDLDNRKLDASAYTPTDLSNYYTKQDVYNKTEVDNAISSIDVSSQLSGFVQSSVFSAYSASVASAIEDNELATSEAINDINSRLINIVDKIDDNELATSEAINDLNSRVINIVDNTYSKTEVDDAIENIDISSQLSNYISLSDFMAYSAATETRIAALEAEINNISSGITAGDY